MLRGGGRKKWSKTVFFAKSPSPRKFFGEKFFMGSTMRKSTDSAFRICGSHRGTYDQKYSYRSSKSGQVGKSGFVTENTGCKKKWMRAQFLKKTSGRQLSHGTTLNRSYLFKILSNLRFSFSSFCVFLAFSAQSSQRSIVKH